MHATSVRALQASKLLMRKSALEPALLFTFSAASQIHTITDQGARQDLSMMQPATMGSMWLGVRTNRSREPKPIETTKIASVSISACSHFGKQFP